ncbi:MAG: hypothetical protein AAF585_24990 [Verrucomicrobiota bacterium]
MSRSRLCQTFAFLCLVAYAPLSPADDQAVVFGDDFDRDDSEEAGNDWTVRGAVGVKDKALFFKAKEEEFRPRAQRTFPAQMEGKITATFLFDWRRESEGTWSFYMQLGNSAEIPRLLVYKEDLAKGIGVNLLWGGGDDVGGLAAGSFGYLKDGKFEALTVANDGKKKETIAENTIVTLEIDIDNAVYDVTFNGKTYADLPFENEGPIDTIRFIANGCSATGFSKSSIDDILISKKQ